MINKIKNKFRDEKVRAGLLAIFMSLTSIIIILEFTDTSLSWKMASLVRPEFLLLGLALHMFSWVFYAIRLRLLASLAGHDITFRLSLISTLASNFLGALTPSSAGGEPLRIKILADDGMSYGSATAVAVGERLLDSIFFVGALAVFLIFTNFLTGFGIKVGAFFLFLLILLRGYPHLWPGSKERPGTGLLFTAWKRRSGLFGTQEFSWPGRQFAILRPWLP